jgi:ABC-type sugar transport system ATPase subunit
MGAQRLAPCRHQRLRIQKDEEQCIMSEYLLQMTGIDKRFGGVHALDHVNFAVRPGKVMCLAGENGCGKSTLV